MGSPCRTCTEAAKRFCAGDQSTLVGDIDNLLAAWAIESRLRSKAEYLRDEARASVRMLVLRCCPVNWEEEADDRRWWGEARASVAEWFQDRLDDAEPVEAGAGDARPVEAGPAEPPDDNARLHADTNQPSQWPPSTDDDDPVPETGDTPTVAEYKSDDSVLCVLHGWPSTVPVAIIATPSGMIGYRPAREGEVGVTRLSDLPQWQGDATQEESAHPADVGDICPECARMETPGALCPHHARTGMPPGKESGGSVICDDCGGTGLIGGDELAGDPPTPCWCASERDMTRLRARQADDVIPLIGPLLDEWDGLSRDQRDYSEELRPHMKNIRERMESGGAVRITRYVPACAQEDVARLREERDDARQRVRDILGGRADNDRAALSEIAAVVAEYEDGAPDASEASRVCARIAAILEKS